MKITIDTSSGNFFVSDKTVKRLILSVECSIKQKKLKSIHTKEIEKKLNDYPFIQKSEVFLNIDGTLHATVRQQEPILRIKENKKNYYLTKEGQPMPLNPDYSAKVILTEGPISKKDRKDLLNLVHYIDNDKLLKNQIIGIQKIAPDSFNLIPQIDRHTIEFGPLTNFDEKFNKLKAFYKQYLNKIQIEQYKIINLQYKNQVVATKR
ncbi:MAG: cell division protein FtsQ/DivIB [Flavobacteriales bacterium Tduv]